LGWWRLFLRRGRDGSLEFSTDIEKGKERLGEKTKGLKGEGKEEKGRE